MFSGHRMAYVGRMLHRGIQPTLAIYQRNISVLCLKRQTTQGFQGLVSIHHSATLCIPNSNHYYSCHQLGHKANSSSLNPCGKDRAWKQLTISPVENFNSARLLALVPATNRVPGSSLHTSSRNRNATYDESRPGKLTGWWRHHRGELKSAPTAALVLGFSGLIPFILPAVYSIATMSCGPNVAFAQVAYGACILSFLGGVRWGFAMTPGETPGWLSLSYSVMPSLIAWMGLMMPIQPGLFCVITGLAFAGIVDSRFKSYPSWFRSLRFFLSTFAILSISVTFGYSLLFPPPEPESGYNFRKLIKIARIIVED